MSTPYLTQAAGKKSVCLDLENPEGNQALHALLQGADIFLENHVPITMQKLSLDNETITKRHKHLIYCSMTGYGRNGPQENTPAYDVNIQAACGLMDMTGTTQSGPVRTGAPILDYSTAIVAAFAISAALFERTKTGNGAFIDVSMLETGLTLMSSSITDYLKTGNQPKRRGNLANSRSPGAGSFECKHGIISLGINEEKHFKYLAIALNKVAWIDDPRFSTRSSRQLNAEILNTELSTILKTRSATDWEVILQNNGVPSARLRSFSEALNCEQVKSRGFV